MWKYTTGLNFVGHHLVFLRVQRDIGYADMATDKHLRAIGFYRSLVVLELCLDMLPSLI